MDFGRTASTHLKNVRVEIPFDALAHLSADAFALLDRDGLVLAWSDAAAALTAISAKSATGADFRSLFQNVDAMIAAGDAAEPVQIGIASEKPVRWLRAASVALDEGRLVSFGPQRRFDQIELLKNELLAAISHELRTPIATIKAYATTLRENPGTIAEHGDEYLRTIDEQTKILARAIDDLMRAARVDADQLPTHRERCSLDDLLDRALEVLPPGDAAYTVNRKTQGVAVYGDPDLLRDLLAHVLENAMKFSPADLAIDVAGATHDGKTVISVRDRGIGIDREHLPYIFERFYRAEHNMTASTQGSGLGLYIVRSLVRAHGGNIAIDSSPGSGTIVTIMLPERL